MVGVRLLSTLSIGLMLAGVPLAASADSLSGRTHGLSMQAQTLATGRSVAKKRRRLPPGSFTNGKPDGANTGGRKQTPTGGNPGDGNHS